MVKMNYGRFASYEPMKWDPFEPIGMHQAYSSHSKANRVYYEYYATTKDGDICIIENPTFSEKFRAIFKYLFKMPFEGKSVKGFLDSIRTLSSTKELNQTDYPDNNTNIIEQPLTQKTNSTPSHKINTYSARFSGYESKMNNTQSIKKNKTNLEHDDYEL